MFKAARKVNYSACGVLGISVCKTYSAEAWFTIDCRSWKLNIYDLNYTLHGTRISPPFGISTSLFALEPSGGRLLGQSHTTTPLPTLHCRVYSRILSGSSGTEGVIPMLGVLTGISPEKWQTPKQLRQPCVRNRHEHSCQANLDRKMVVLDPVLSPGGALHCANNTCPPMLPGTLGSVSQSPTAHGGETKVILLCSVFFSGPCAYIHGARDP